MILATVKSKNGVVIRLTDERWHHIILTHQEIGSNDFNELLRSKLRSILEESSFRTIHPRSKLRGILVQK